MTVCALCGEIAPLLAPLHYCANCVRWLVDEHGPILLDPGDPAPAWLNAWDAIGDIDIPVLVPDTMGQLAPLWRPA